MCLEPAGTGVPQQDGVESVSKEELVGTKRKYRQHTAEEKVAILSSS